MDSYTTDATAQNDFLIDLLGDSNQGEFQTLNEEISFTEYVARVLENPKLIRTAHQRVYDMIMDQGTRTFERFRRSLVHYNFFDNSSEPIFGLEETLHDLVQHFRGAAGHYGTEKRILLLHGPVGSSKSTICRSLKRGMEAYSRTPQGAWYTYKWVDLPTGPDGVYNKHEDEAAMHEDPILFLPPAAREKFLKRVNAVHLDSTPEGDRTNQYTLRPEGELNPRSKFFLNFLLRQNGGDLMTVLEKHVRVIRKVYSEADRVGIGTFQPKDEKNQDATELTGDINYAQLTQFGSDSDPRAFNFDGEFCKGNRGVVEFIEMLKLAKEFLYDLLGASQEHAIKPKKFSQVTIDEVIIGHSVHGSTPVPHAYDGVLDVRPIEQMENLDPTRLKVFSVNVETRRVELSGVRSVFAHDFEGDWVENHQNGDCLVTTPNHSVYNEDYEKFYPGEDTTSPILECAIPTELIAGMPRTGRWVKFFDESADVPDDSLLSDGHPVRTAGGFKAA